ncbi:LOW QUALITY PROTEIN: uncharacterized protein ACJ7VT_001609 [Polymixia lowei]
MVRRVAVVGGGSSGLACIKICLDEGLEPVCFESSDDIGGLWRYKESPEPGRSSIYRSLVVNTSKEMMCFSDFPMPADYANYMHNSQLLQYIRLYAEHFDLRRYIHFQTTVKSVRQRPDFSQSGQWDVVTVNRGGEENTHIFDGVLVCSGHYTHPVSPLGDFQGHKTFPGRCYHSWEYKDADIFRGKRVVVVGIGNSGGDIAVEISRSAEKIFLSTRQGAWVVGRMSSSGLPLDMTAITRFYNILTLLLPKALINWVAERALNHKYDHRLYGLMPKHRLLDKKPLVNDDLPGRILQGALVMKPNLCGFQGSGLVFEDGTVEENIDAVVFCTGYNGTFPFLPPSLSAGPGGEVTLYKRLFPPSLKHPTLAIMGLFQTKGPIMPIVEMQARWATKAIAGLSHLPPKETMVAVIQSERKGYMKSYRCPRQAALQVDYIPYLDFMAEEIGVRPNILGLLLRDPVLGLKVFLGPCTPYQYRLAGPGQWAGARQAILTQWDRVAQPFRTRVVPEPETRPSTHLSPWLLTLSLVTVMMAVLLSQNKLSAVLHGQSELLDRLQTLLLGTSLGFSFNMVQRVAVIGAGPSGLTSIKACLDEGLEPTCFESSHDIGGLWRFKEEPEPGRANIYHSVVVNSSKEMMSFSDFPPPAELPNNMHHSEVLLYLRLYAQAFTLLQHVRFQTTVVDVRQSPDFPVTAQWEVETEGREGQREVHVFDAVIVCTGHFTQPHLPLEDFPGIESFEGRYFHSWEYRSAESLQGKRVVVIGMGNSGGDIAVDISRVAEKVYLSTRSGAWVVSRVGEGGLPGDLIGTSRFDLMRMRLLSSWSAKIVEKKLNQAFDHRLYGLKPKHGFFAQIPVVNDDLPGRIISGRVRVKPNLKEFRGSSVVFVDGSIVDKVDVVVFATGYNYNFPFLPSALQAKSGYRLRLYQNVFPPGLSQPTLAVVGFIHALGAINPLAEMQARWATRVFKGLTTLPPEEVMLNDIEKDTATMYQRFTCSERNPVQVDYLPHLDSLAERVGVRPNILWLLLKDPRLGLQVFLGPCTPYQYRLTGPGQWAGARQAILTQWERVAQPFRTRMVPETETRPSSRLSLILALSGTVLLCCSLYNKHSLSCSCLLSNSTGLLIKLHDYVTDEMGMERIA